LNAKLHQREAEIVAQAGQAGTVTIATNMAGRGTDIKLGPGVKEAGGLAIIGTERHDSRRVDRQLRGRAGRQGDPGSSQFFVSLEDDLMRLFGSDRIAKLMDRMGIEEGEVIQHSMITKSIERAQKKVEENNFGTRKRLLEYDDVMNSQREVIYGKRRHALFGERLSIDIANTMYDVCADIIKEHADAKDYESFNLDLIRNFSIESPIAREEFLKGGKHLEDTVFDAAYAHYQHKSKQIAESAFPVVKNVYEKSAHMYENIVIPFTDGMKTMQVLANLKKAYETQGRELITSFEKGVILAIIDEAWKEHLRELDELKQSVQNAVYEQKDPLLVYKFESFELFRQMINKLNRDITSFLVKAYLPQENQQQVREVQTTTTQAPQRYQTNRTDDTPGNMPAPGQSSAPDPELEKPKLQPIRVEKSVGRNDPCPCGSGKKFKQCHGAA
jgi:preprotein translocase subunit SecA